jgi:small-conductance mechanosensitive channel
MSTLEQKLEEIEKKVKKLVEQNVQYQQICEDLLTSRRSLENEIEVLNQKLAGQSEKVENLEDNSKQLKIAHQEDNEGLKKRINQYIEDIDTSVEWLKQL